VIIGGRLRESHGSFHPKRVSRARAPFSEAERRKPTRFPRPRPFLRSFFFSFSLSLSLSLFLLFTHNTAPNATGNAIAKWFALSFREFRSMWKPVN